MPTAFQDEIFKQRLARREIWINGEINEELVERLIVNLLTMDESENDRREPRTIKVFINSYGGNLRESLVAVDVMLSLNSPVETIALGEATSAGLILLIGGQNRKAYERTTLMFHTSRGLIGGVLPDAESNLEHRKRLIEMKADLFGNRTKWPRQKWLELLEGGRDHYFTAQEALKIGILTDVIKPSTRESLVSELPAPEIQPLLVEPPTLSVLEISTNGAAKLLVAENATVSEEALTSKSKDKKRKK